MSLDRKWLVLIPTQIEFQHLSFGDLTNVQVELCGFGPVAAAARAAALIAKHCPDRVLLTGIAGTYADELELGRAYQFRNVGCYGIGVGIGRSFSRASDVGWKQWDGETKIGDQLELSVYEGADKSIQGHVTTVCAASSTASETNLVRKIEPDSVAEDMEAFAVAVAARLACTPIYVVRGISNFAGNRDKTSWRIADALKSANLLALDIIRNAT